MNQAVENYISECPEDAADYETAVAAWEEFENGDRKTYTSEELREDFGL